ncbi:MAG: hypothetical protein HFJ64_06245 [Eggerthellaceae bacterium]|nr:hypothetical protein [Eggerthellaceae bacterium]
MLSKETGEEVFTGGSSDPDGVRRVCDEAIRIIKLADDPVTEEEYMQLLESWGDLPEAFKEAVRKQQKSATPSI